jgi:hypothetical protein
MVVCLFDSVRPHKVKNSVVIRGNSGVSKHTLLVVLIQLQKF